MRHFLFSVPLLFLLCSTCLADAPSKPCKVFSLQIIMLRRADIESDCLYGLQNISVLQSTGDGYLLSVQRSAGMGNPSLVFLYPSSDISFNYQNQHLGNAYKAYYAGDYSYQTITGFSQTIPAFRLAVIPEKMRPENRVFDG